MDRTGSPPAPAAPGVAPGVPRLWSLGVALVALAVYLLESPPVSGDKDSAEFTLVLALNGLSHPTGYPIFTLLGHLFVVLVHALGTTWAYAANAWTALGGAVAMYFLHRLAAELVPPEAPLGHRARFLLGLLPVGLFAFNPVWTYETTLAEVYAWHVAWVLGVSLFFVRLARGLARHEPWSTRRLYARALTWGFLCGLGGAHHATSIFIAAPFSLALLVPLVARRRFRLGLVAAGLAAACVPLLSYGFIYWRGLHPAPVHWFTLKPGLQGLLSHVTARQYLHNLGYFAPSPEQRRFLVWYVFPFLVPGLLVLLANAVRARDLSERTVLWSIALSAIAGAAYALQYGVADPSSYFLYPMALGLATVAPGVGALLTGGHRARRVALAGAALLGTAALVLWVPWLKTNQRRVGLFVSFDRLVHGMWESIPMDSAIVFWTNDMYYKLPEYQLLRGEKPNLTVVHGIMIYSEGQRARFIRRYGFDPTAGIVFRVPPSLSLAEKNALMQKAVSEAIERTNAMTRIPVIVFDPSVPTVRLLKKPAPDSAASRPGAADPHRPGRGNGSGGGPRPWP